MYFNFCETRGNGKRKSSFPKTNKMKRYNITEIYRTFFRKRKDIFFIDGKIVGWVLIQLSESIVSARVLEVLVISIQELILKTL
jgi:hypothetical protein